MILAEMYDAWYTVFYDLRTVHMIFWYSQTRWKFAEEFQWVWQHEEPSKLFQNTSFQGFISKIYKIELLYNKESTIIFFVKLVVDGGEMKYLPMTD